jgi:hypothetical protein
MVKGITPADVLHELLDPAEPEAGAVMSGQASGIVEALKTRQHP